MATTLIDTAGWQVVVPIKPALDLAGSHLTCTLTDRFGGAVVSLDSATLLPAYGVDQISWTSDPITGLTGSLLLTVTKAMRGSWLATGPNGLPGLVTLFADVQRTIAGSQRDPVPLARTSLSVVPGTDSPAVAIQVGGRSPVLAPLQGLQAVTASALSVGPQGPPGGGTGPGQTIYQITAASTFTASHNYQGRPSVLLLLPSGEEVETDTFYADGHVTLVFAQPFTGALYLG